MKVDERTTALQLLLEIERQQSYSNLLLRQRLREKDARFAARVTALVYGVLERRVTLDALIAHYTKKPVNKLDLEVPDDPAAGILSAVVPGRRTRTMRR